MDYEKLIEDLKSYAQEYASGDTLGRAIIDTEVLMYEAAEAIERLLQNGAETQLAKPLTIDQLKRMNGRPAWWDGRNGEGCWGIIEVDSDGAYAGKPFFAGRWRNINFSWDIKKRKMRIYARELSQTETREKC